MGKVCIFVHISKKQAQVCALVCAHIIFFKTLIKTIYILGLFNVSGVNPNLHIIIGMFNVSGVPIWPGRTRPGAVQDQAGPHLLQAPPAQDHEGPLPDQPEPRLQGAQDVVTEDWSRQKGSAGERGKTTIWPCHGRYSSH